MQNSNVSYQMEFSISADAAQSLSSQYRVEVKPFAIRIDAVCEPSPAGHGTWRAWVTGANHIDDVDGAIAIPRQMFPGGDDFAEGPTAASASMQAFEKFLRFHQFA